MKRDELKHIIREEVSAVMSEGPEWDDNTNAIRDDFWLWEGGWSDWIIFSEKKYPKDKVFKKLNGEVRKLLLKVEEHLDGEYRDWD